MEASGLHYFQLFGDVIPSVGKFAAGWRDVCLKHCLDGLGM